MNIEEQLYALGQTAGADGHAMLTANVAAWHSEPVGEFTILINVPNDYSVSYTSHLSIADAFQKAWIGVNTDCGSSLNPTNDAVHRAVGYDNIGY